MQWNDGWHWLALGLLGNAIFGSRFLVYGFVYLRNLALLRRDAVAVEGAPARMEAVG